MDITTLSWCEAESMWAWLSQRYIGDPWCLRVPISEWRCSCLYPRSTSTTARGMCRSQNMDLLGIMTLQGHSMLTLVTINTDLALWLWLFCIVCTETKGEFTDPAPVKGPLDPLGPHCSSHILRERPDCRPVNPWEKTSPLESRAKGKLLLWGTRNKKRKLATKLLLICLIGDHAWI